MRLRCCCCYLFILFSFVRYVLYLCLRSLLVGSTVTVDSSLPRLVRCSHSSLRLLPHHTYVGWLPYVWFVRWFTIAYTHTQLDSFPQPPCPHLTLPCNLVALPCLTLPWGSVGFIFGLGMVRHCVNLSKSMVCFLNHLFATSSLLLEVLAVSVCFERFWWAEHFYLALCDLVPHLVPPYPIPALPYCITCVCQNLSTFFLYNFGLWHDITWSWWLINGDIFLLRFAFLVACFLLFLWVFGIAGGWWRFWFISPILHLSVV